MGDLIKAVIIIIGSIMTFMIGVVFFAVIGGTILWLLWPIGVPAAFPRIVNEGWLAPHLSWWQAVCVSWIAGILVKSSSSSSSKD